MLKIQQQTSGDCQRRPTRFGASFEPQQQVAHTIATATSKALKCSTITRVPTARPKSRLRPPVALSTSSSNGSRSIEKTTNAVSSQLARPPHPISEPRARPSSLALKTRSRETTKSHMNGNEHSKSSSQSNLIDLPKLQTKLPNYNNGKSVDGGTKSSICQAVKKSALSNIKSNGSNTIASNYSTKTTATIKRKCASKTSAVSVPNNESRSSGFKNLVAVVHPQNSAQRVNFNAAATAITTTISKLSPTMMKYTTANTFKNEKGKLNSKEAGLNYNKKSSKESKQDESQIVSRQSNKAEASSATTPGVAVTNTDQIKTDASRSPTITTSNQGHEFRSGQFSLGNNNNNLNCLLSVASNNGRKPRDKKQHGQQDEQSNKLLPAQTSQSPSNTNLSASSTIDHNIHGDDHRGTFSGNNNIIIDSNCYKHDGPKLSLPKSPAMQNFNGGNICKGGRTINDRLLPKPMGQQVLSLMMLDVGLLPANNNQQQQQISPSNQRSHVSLASPSGRFEMTSSNGCFNTQLFGNGQSFINHNDGDGGEYDEDATNRLDRCSSIDCNQHEQSNDFHSLQPQSPSAAAHEAPRLQVRLDIPTQDNENQRSFSLPSSPRIKVRAQADQHRFGNLFEIEHQKQPFRQANHIPQSDHPSGHENFCVKSTLVLSSPEQQLFNTTEQLLSACDNQDSLSMTSSSCSSLNHCPPLLALSNRLNVFKFKELVKTNVDMNMKHKQGDLSESNTGVEDKKATNIKVTGTTTPTSVTPNLQTSDQVAQVAKQHELLTNDANFDIGKYLLNKIDHERACIRESSTATGNSSRGHEIEGPNRHTNFSTNEQKPSDENCSNQHLSRRQQQPRSHSISGQEFHANGGYQRLKQYGLQQLDGYPNHQAGGQSNRLHQIPSPYQQQLLGRSPSPSSIGYQTNYGPSHRAELPVKYPLDRQPANQLHASLECLNTTNYTDYHQLQRLQEHHQQQQQQLHHHYQQQQQQQQQQHQIHQQQPQPTQNQHYAASYVQYSAPPANTIINQNGDQDLAAAAMGTPPTQCLSIRTASGSPTNNCNDGNNSTSNHINLASYNHQTQNLINRAMAQVSHSPLRRIGGLTTTASGTSSSILNQLSSLSHPIRAGHSSLSLASSSFMIEDKLQNEIRKLQSELKSEKEKNEALNSQLSINSSLMAAFEQSLTTLNTRLRQLTTLNEKKDNDIEELREQLRLSRLEVNLDKDTGSKDVNKCTNDDNVVGRWTPTPTRHSETDASSERDMMLKTIEDLKRQLIERDRLLTDTRLEALSAAHQLEQLESKLNGEHSILAQEDELDEGVMVVNHSPSDSDAITDSAHFSEINSQMSKSSNNNNHNHQNQHFDGDSNCFSPNNMLNNDGNNNCNGSGIMMSNRTADANNNTDDRQSNHSSDYQVEHRDVKDRMTLSDSVSQQFNETDSGVMCKLMDNLLLTN